MKPIKFKEQNITFAENQPQYMPLPAFKDSSNEGIVIFCEYLSLWERLRVLFTGKIWVRFLTFNKPLTPSAFTTKKSDVLVRI